MKRDILPIIAIFLLVTADCQAGFLDDLSKELGLPSMQQTTLDDALRLSMDSRKPFPPAPIGPSRQSQNQTAFSETRR